MRESGVEIDRSDISSTSRIIGQIDIGDVSDTAGRIYSIDYLIG